MHMDWTVHISEIIYNPGRAYCFVNDYFRSSGKKEKENSAANTSRDCTQTTHFQPDPLHQFEPNLCLWNPCAHPGDLPESNCFRPSLHFHPVHHHAFHLAPH